MDNPGEEPSEVKTADGFDIPFLPEFKKRKLSNHNAASSSSCVREAETNPEDRPVKDDSVSFCKMPSRLVKVLDMQEQNIQESKGIDKCMHF